MISLERRHPHIYVFVQTISLFRSLDMIKICKIKIELKMAQMKNLRGSNVVLV